MDMDSGLVTTKRPLHSYERFNLTVVATDGGEPPLWGTTMLLVEVIDVNDNRPVFVRPPNGTILHIREVLLSPGASCPPHPPSDIQTAFSSYSHAWESERAPTVKVEKLMPEQGTDLLSATQGITEQWLVIWALSAKGLMFKSNFITYQPNYLEQVTSLSLVFFICRMGLIIVDAPSLALKYLPRRTVSQKSTSPLLSQNKHTPSVCLLFLPISKWKQPGS